MFSTNVHPSQKKRTNNQRSQNAVVSSNNPIPNSNKKLWKLPHVFASVLELPFRSDDDVSIEETTQFLRFVASCKCNNNNNNNKNKFNGKGCCGVRAHAIEIVPGVTKIVIKGMDGGDCFTDQYRFGGGSGVDVWRFRLPPWMRPEMATAVCSGGKLVVTVPKSRAEKCRQLVGEEASSKSGKFTVLNCFDMGTGTLACGVKEGVKLYFHNIRAAHVEKARNDAVQSALADAKSQGMSPTDSAKYAEKEGAKAAKLATQKAKRIIGPVISSGWDFFEAVYYGGTSAEGFLRGSGTLVGTYAGGFLGEQRLGRVGYLVGSQMGSWIGGRIGLMLYDVVNAVHFLLQFGQTH